MKRFLSMVMTIMLAASSVVVFTGCGSSTGTHADITRLDDDGYLYYMDYTKDYYGKDVMDAMRKVGFIDSGCSNFFTHNTDGEPITCRNYDYPHRVSKEDRSLTGLNVVLHCKPEGKYESIAVADAVWCDEENPMFQKGGPDLEGFDISMMVIESRNSEIEVISADICTNFFLGSNDMEDSYRNDKLREEAVKMTDEELVSDYKYDYGYGHGYHRFAAILGQLECYRDTEKKDYYTRMPESAALVILRSVVQNSYTSAAGTSMTQYSAIYNNEKKTVEVWPFQNYSKSFTFDVEGNQISSDQ